MSVVQQMGLRLPVVAAPMFLISSPDMVIEACRSGVIGAFPTPNCRTTDELDQWMQRISAETAENAAPWAANLVTHRTNDRLGSDLELIAKYKPKVVITALGSPKPAIDVVKAYGGVVLADVVTTELARKAIQVGADGLVCVSSGAGGHTGHLSPFAFVAAVRSFFDGIVCVGGGISDGAGVAGAVAAGADLVYVGTRFIATDESLAPKAYKDMLIASQIEDLIVSAAITGTAASWLKPSLRALGIDPEAMSASTTRDYGGDTAKRWKDLWAAGQGLHAISEVQPVSAVVQSLVDGYRAAVRRQSDLAYGIA